MAELKEKPLYIVVFILVISALCAFSLTFVKESLKDKITANRELSEKKTVLDTLKIKYSADNTDEIDALFAKYLTYNSGEFPYFVYTVENEINAYIVKISGSGLWGAMRAFLAVNKDLDTILSLRFYEHEETPGLGGRISDFDYISKFDNLTVKADGLKGVRIINNPAHANEVDAITGATITSQKVEELINKNLELLWVYFNTKKDTE